MVFCGKPSPACQSCRQRRIKCDLRRPGCTQCSNISTPCPGYRNVLDLCFRDESESVARKVQNKQKKLAIRDHRARDRKSPTLSDTDSSSVVSDDSSNSDLDYASFDLAYAISKALMLPIEQIATSHFFSTYVPEGHFNYLPELYRDLTPDSPLSPVVHAVAIANLSRELNAPDLQANAQYYYTRALTATNSALTCPKKAKKDSTLVSVLLLSLFETLTQQYRQLPPGWTNHTEGAVALLKMRGLEQFQTKLGSQLYLQVSSNIRVSSAQRCVRVPAEFLEFNELAMPYLDGNNPTLRVSLIVDAFAKLREAVARQHVGNAAFIIDSATQLDQSVLQLLSSLPENCNYDIIPVDLSELGVFNGVKHRYRDHRFAQYWNSLRMIRIFLNEMVYRQIAAMTIEYDSYGWEVPEDWALLQEMNARNVLRLASDICASVPQFTQAPAGQPLPVAPAAFLLWPLSAAGESFLSTEPVRQYCIDRLKFLGKEARLPQAQWAAQMLEESEKLEDWYVTHVSSWLNDEVFSATRDRSGDGLNFCPILLLGPAATNFRPSVLTVHIRAPHSNISASNRTQNACELGGNVDVPQYGQFRRSKLRPIVWGIRKLEIQSGNWSAIVNWKTDGKLSFVALMLDTHHDTENDYEL